MDKQDFEKAMLDVAKVFASPEEIAKAADLSRAEKLKLLQQWEYDVNMLLVAGEENMPSQGPKSESGGTAELLRAIHKTVAQIGGGANPENTGPAKAGGIQVPDEPSLQKRGKDKASSVS